MKTIYRYILRESAIYFSISLLVFLGILLTVRMLRLTSLIVNKGVAFSQVATVFVAIIPTFLEVAIPMATLLGIMLAFARLSGDSEIVVIRASGISIRQLIAPVLLFAGLAALATLIVDLQFRPWGYRTLSRTLFEIASTKSTSGLNEGVFNSLGKITLYAEKIDHRTGALTRVLVDDRRTENQRKILTSQHGVISSDPETRSIRFDLHDGYIHEQNQGRYDLTKYDSNGIVVSSEEVYDPDAIKKDRSSVELTMGELRAQRNQVKRLILLKRGDPDAQPDPDSKIPPALAKLSSKELKKKLTRLKIENGRRVSMPFAAVFLALIAMPLGIQPPRAQKAWGIGLSAVLGMMVFVLYYGVLSIGLTLAEGGQISPYLALWLPNILSGLIGIYALKMIGSEKWQSIAQGLSPLVRPFRRFSGPVSVSS